MLEKIIIVAHTQNRIIGRDNAMPWHLPRDLRYFKQQTQGHPVIMGRKTYESLGKALPHRANFVVSRQALDLPDAQLAASLPDAIDLAGKLGDKIFIIGGAQIYAEALKQELVDTVLATLIHTTLEGDSFFPALDAAHWRQTGVETVPADGNNAYDMTFLRFERINRRFLSP